MRPPRVPALAAVLVLCASHALAQSFPTKPIRVIVPNPPGGSADVLSRLMSTRFAQEIGQSVVVDNRAGANGIVGSEVAAKSTPDGYTLLLGSSSQYAINAATTRNLPYDALKSFAPISQIASQPLLITIHPKVPAASLTEFVKLARAQPGKLNFGASGPAVTLPVEHFNGIAGIKLQSVPYRGGGPATTAVLGGEIEMLWATIVSIHPHVQSGRLRALGVTSERRSPLAPDLPTVAESYPGFEATVWHALAAPAGTPGTVVDQLVAATHKVLAATDVRDLLARQGVEAVTSTPAQLGEKIRSEIARWQAVIRDAKIQIE